MSNEWSLVFFTSLVDLGCGLFIFLALNEWFGWNQSVRLKGGIVSIIILALGGLASVTHLGHPERIFAALGHPTSGIFMESSMIGITGICVIAYLYAIKREASHGVLKLITCIGGITSIILAFAVGDSYVMAARPAWDTLTMPFVYLGSSVLMGSIAYAVLADIQDKVMASKLKSLMQVLIAIQTVLIIFYLVAIAKAPFPDESRSLSLILSGNLAILFWAGIVIFGLVAPFILVTISQQNNFVTLSTVPLILGLVSAFLGAAAYRILMFKLGSAVWQFF